MSSKEEIEQAIARRRDNYKSYRLDFPSSATKWTVACAIELRIERDNSILADAYDAIHASLKVRDVERDIEIDSAFIEYVGGRLENNPAAGANQFVLFKTVRIARHGSTGWRWWLGKFLGDTAMPIRTRGQLLDLLSAIGAR